MSASSVGRAFERLGLPLKKTLFASERDERERAAWRERVTEIDPTRLIFVDECGTHTSMVRRYAKAPKGRRVCGSVPATAARTPRLSLRSRSEGSARRWCLKGRPPRQSSKPTSSEFWSPCSKQERVVIMDNLGAHKEQRVQELTEARGAILLFLPAYSPDFSPIEEAFSKIKALLKKAAARTRESLVEAIREALSAVTPRDVLGCFAHCGYQIEAQ